jgi:hypothetical protein
MSHIEIMKFCQNYWSLLPTVQMSKGGQTMDRRTEKIIFLLRLNDTTVIGHQKGSKSEKSEIFRA